ncbi:MAG: substrate-binding domain-containing protein [Rhodospirillales bacterium]
MTDASHEHVLALDGIAIIVNPANPVSALTKAQLHDIFDGSIKNWSQVGGTRRRDPSVRARRQVRHVRHVQIAGARPRQDRSRRPPHRGQPRIVQ